MTVEPDVEAGYGGGRGAKGRLTDVFTLVKCSQVGEIKPLGDRLDAMLALVAAMGMVQTTTSDAEPPQDRSKKRKPPSTPRAALEQRVRDAAAEFLRDVLLGSSKNLQRAALQGSRRSSNDDDDQRWRGET